MFVGREDLVETLVEYMKGDSKVNKPDKPFVVTGQSGCGKTALLAKAAEEAASLESNPIVITRFIGTSVDSYTAAGVMRSICLQILSIFDRDVRDVPTLYNKLIPFFYSCMGLPSQKGQHLIVILDSLDQLSNDDYARNLSWLPMRKTLPPGVRLIVSSLWDSNAEHCNDMKAPLGAILGMIPVANVLHVESLRVAEVRSIFDSMMDKGGRGLNDEQRMAVLIAVSRPPIIPLYVRLAVDRALTWKSYAMDQDIHIPENVPGLIDELFDSLELNYGEMLVRTAMSLITASSKGLSQTELEDILSCDETVLHEVYMSGKFEDPLCRFPQSVWVMIRNELGSYLVERGIDGVTVYVWYHRQFRERAKSRYLKEDQPEAVKAVVKIRSALADYFDNRYNKPLPYTTLPENGSITKNVDRHVQDNSILIADSGIAESRKLNMRKLRELPHQLLKLRDYHRYMETICHLQFVEAKFEAHQGYKCLAELQQTRSVTCSPAIKAWTKFIGAHLSHIIHRPAAVYQLASQQVSWNCIRKQLEATGTPSGTRLIVDTDRRDSFEDACELTLQGHGHSVRSCSYSRDGRQIASTGEDGSLRVWDSRTGACRIITDELPGRKHDDITNNYLGYQPCTFTHSGRHIVTGSDNGWLKLWDTQNCKQVSISYKRNYIVTSVKFSHSGTRLAVTYAFADPDGSNDPTNDKKQKPLNSAGWVSFHGFGVQPVHHLPSELCLLNERKVDLVGGALGCDWSPDDSRLCVALQTGVGALAIINTTNYLIVKQIEGTDNYDSTTRCCAYSPNGDRIATAGTDRVVTLWDADAEKCLAIDNDKKHYGAIWFVVFTADGKHVISCSSDRSAKIWNTSTYECVATLVGHLDRVFGASLDSIQKGKESTRLVTASRDGSLKIWDLRACLEGRVPDATGIHCTVGKISPNGRHAVLSRGWNNFCEFRRLDGGKLVDVEVRTDTGNVHPYCIRRAVFTADSTKLVSIDRGNDGPKMPDELQFATVKICSVPDGRIVRDLESEITAPFSVSSNDFFIVIGTGDNSVIYVYGVTNLSLLSTWRFDDSSCPSTQPKEETKVAAVACSPANHGHVAAGSKKIVKVWDIGTTGKSRRLLVSLQFSSTIRTVNYSPNGRHLAVATSNGSVCVYSEAYGQQCSLDPGHTALVLDAAFSPDSRLLATVSTDMSLFVWDLAGRRSRGPWAAWYGPVSCLDFIDNDRLLVGEATGNIRVLKMMD